MNGFTAADMTTAAANGHAEGYQAGYADAVKAVAVSKTESTTAAAQEAVAWLSPGDLELFARDSRNLHVRGLSKKTERYTVPLYAAPVAAAPVDDVQLALIGRRHFNGPAPQAWYAAARELLAGTPAAPGIDLEQFRNAATELAESALSQSHAGYCRCWEYGAEESRCDCGLTETKEQARNLLALIDASPKGDVHPDDLAVDAFAAAMKAKLADARAKGCGGWNGDEPGMQQRLSDMLRAHIEKGDPRDVANFCMFLHQRGEAISPKGGSEPDAYMVRWHPIGGTDKRARWVEVDAETFALMQQNPGGLLRSEFATLHMQPTSAEAGS